MRPSTMWGSCKRWKGPDPSKRSVYIPKLTPVGHHAAEGGETERTVAWAPMKTDSNTACASCGKRNVNLGTWKACSEGEPYCKPCFVEMHSVGGVSFLSVQPTILYPTDYTLSLLWHDTLAKEPAPVNGTSSISLSENLTMQSQDGQQKSDNTMED